MTLRTISLRLDESLFNALDKKALIEGKTKTDLVTEFILQGLNGGEPAEFGSLMSRLDRMESELKELTTKAVICSAANRFYGQQTTSFMVDLGKYIQGEELLSTEEKLKLVKERDNKANEFARQFVDSKENGQK